jgi:hypothetical protein
MSRRVLTANQKALIRSLSAQGFSISQIEAATGCSYNAVRKYGAASLPPKKSTGRWTQAERAFAAALINSAKALTSTQIAALCSKEFGREISRNAIIGQAHVQGLKLKGKPGFQSGQPNPSRRKTLTRQARQWPADREKALIAIAATVSTARAAAAVMTHQFAVKFTSVQVHSKLKRLGLHLPMGDGRGAIDFRTRAKTSSLVSCAQPGAFPTMNHAPFGPVRGSAVMLYGAEILSAGQDPVGCRFVHGDPGGASKTNDWRYCQAETGAATYCARHRALLKIGNPSTDNSHSSHGSAA